MAIRFILKACTIFGIAAAIFGYYLFDLRRTAGNAFPAAAKIFLGVVGMLILFAIAFGIYLIGTPGVQRALQFDERRISDLQQISYAVDAYWQSNNALPKSFADLKSQPYSYIQSVLDPKTNLPYEYKTLTEKSYELCAVFETDSSRYASKFRTPVPFSQEQWNHGTGRVCFEKQEQISIKAGTVPAFR